MDQNMAPEGASLAAVRKRSWLASLLAADDEIENLREQFYVTLRAYLAHIETQTPTASRALERVRALLLDGRPPRWSECYEAEQLLVHLFDERTVAVELEVRLLEAQTNLRPALGEFYSRSVERAATAAERRALLARLVNDLQWRYTIEEGKRRFSKSLTTRTGVAFLVALSCFAGLATFAYIESWEFRVGDLRLLAAAGVAGTWGATFSMLTALKTRIEESAIYDLNVMRAITMVMARALVGSGAACVLYLFFSSGFLTGPAFPMLANTNGALSCAADPASKCLQPAVVSLLVIWCFLAGFSEKLVPGLLAKAEGSADKRRLDEIAPDGQRYRPSEVKSPADVSNGQSAPPAASGTGKHEGPTPPS